MNTPTWRQIWNWTLFLTIGMPMLLLLLFIIAAFIHGSVL